MAELLGSWSVHRSAMPLGWMLAAMLGVQLAQQTDYLSVQMSAEPLDDPSA